MKIIKEDRSVIPSLDIEDINRIKQVVEETCSVEGIGGYKVGFESVIPHGMTKIIETIRDITNLPVIYDHQKSGTDIPDTGAKFMRVCKSSGADAVIIFPQAGPATEAAWIKAATEQSIPVIVGGEMTHPQYLVSDGGFIDDGAPKRMYETAAKAGVMDFVVPGNKPERINYYKGFLESIAIKPVLYSPGLITQGGQLSDSAKAAGERWHAIIGRAIYQAKNINEETKIICKTLKQT